MLQIHIRNAINNKTPENELLYKTTKNLQYIMKFVIRSRILFAKLNDDRDQDMFEASLEGNCPLAHKQKTRRPKNNSLTRNSEANVIAQKFKRTDLNYNLRISLFFFLSLFVHRSYNFRFGRFAAVVHQTDRLSK